MGFNFFPHRTGMKLRPGVEADWLQDLTEDQSLTAAFPGENNKTG